MLGFHLRDAFSKIAAKVTNFGELVVAPISYSDTVFLNMGVINIAFNFYIPKPGLQFVITGIFAKANRNVSAVTDANVVVYEAESAETITKDKVLFQFPLIRGEASNVPLLNIIVSEGKFVNGQTDDDDIFMTISGYYIKDLTK